MPASRPSSAWWRWKCAAASALAPCTSGARRSRGADVHFAADLPQAEDHALHPVHVRSRRGIGGVVRCARPGGAHDGFAGDAGDRRHALPDLLGDEGHQRMQRAQQRLEHREQRAPRDRGGGLVLALQHGLGQFQVPVAELVPGEFVQRRGGVVEAVVGEALVVVGDGMAQARDDPAVDHLRRNGARRRDRLALGHQQHEARGIPQLVAEVAVARHASEFEADVAALRGERGERESQRIGAVGLDALGKLLARGLVDGRGQVRLHQAGGALLQQRLPA